MATTNHESHMRWAIALALEGAGKTSPNPVVGALVVKGNRVIGEGYHEKAGTSHAEIHALGQAGSRARGADLYVTLEPCCHSGRTPPCVDAIIEAGISCVIVGTRDPNPLVDGRGIRALRRAKIRVVEGVLKESCRRINEPYNRFITSGMPFLVAKVALSLDGKIAAPSGDSKWITNEECRGYVHRMRAQADAVIVGGGTVRRDDPRLDARLPGRVGLQPRAIVVDKALRLPRSAKIFKRRSGGLLVATTRRAPSSMVKFVEGMGHEVFFCRADSKGRVHLRSLMKELGRRGVALAMLEGGGELFASFFKGRLVDRVVACLAPKFIGGEGMDFLPGMSIRKLGSALSLSDVSVKIMGDNLVVEGKIERDR